MVLEEEKKPEINLIKLLRQKLEQDYEVDLQAVKEKYKEKFEALEILRKDYDSEVVQELKENVEEYKRLDEQKVEKKEIDYESQLRKIVLDCIKSYLAVFTEENILRVIKVKYPNFTIDVKLITQLLKQLVQQEKLLVWAKYKNILYYQDSKIKRSIKDSIFSLQKQLQPTTLADVLPTRVLRKKQTPV